MAAVNEEVAAVRRHLPAGGTLEDVQYGRTFTQEEVEQRLAKWLNG